MELKKIITLPFEIVFFTIFALGFAIFALFFRGLHYIIGGDEQ